MATSYVFFLAIFIAYGCACVCTSLLLYFHLTLTSSRCCWLMCDLLLMARGCILLWMMLLVNHVRLWHDGIIYSSTGRARGYIVLLQVNVAATIRWHCGTGCCGAGHCCNIILGRTATLDGFLWETVKTKIIKLQFIRKMSAKY